MTTPTAAIDAAPMTKAEKLAAALLADRTRTDTRNANIVPCYICSHTFVYQGRRGDDLFSNGRFCSMHCQDWYDAGNGPISSSDPFDVQLGDWLVIAGPPGVEIGSRYYAGIFGDRLGAPMKRTTAGFKIPCANCRKEFDSTGLRCCSPECERRYRERQTNIAVMAEAGIEPTAKRQCAECGGRIPMWRNGRKVSSATRFCSPKCSRRAKVAAA